MPETFDGGPLEASEASRRLARVGFDIHDGPLQELALLCGELQDMQYAIAGGDTTSAVVRLQDLHGFASAVEASLRELAGSIEGRALARRDLGEMLASAARLCAMRGGAEVDLSVEGDLDALPDAHRVAVARLVQEALSNARRHARAGAIGVHVAVRDDRVDVIVVDDGVGFEVEQSVVDAARRGSLGLMGMLERGRLLGGHCDIASRPGAGTTVTLRLPLEAAVEQRLTA